MKRIILYFFPLLLFLSCSVENASILEGKADLSQSGLNTLWRLDGLWEFSSKGEDGVIAVPSIWKGNITSGSYFLSIKVPRASRQYSLYIRDCFTQYKLTVNGDVLHQGKTPSIKPRLFTFTAADQLDIRIDVEDRETTYGGIKSSVFLGPSELVFQIFNIRILGDQLLIGALLFAALFYLSIGLVDRKGGGREYLSLFFANLLMAIRFLTTYNRILLLYIDSFHVIEKISTATTPFIAIAYSLYFLRHYRYPGYTKIIRGFIILSALYAVLVFVLPIKTIYIISPFYLGLILIAIYVTVYISIIHFRTAELKQTVVVWLFALAALVYLLVRSFLIWNGLIADQNHQLYALLMILQGIQNAIRYGETFKHNVSLIQQKDDLFSRVSHSLKTPLYALKGSIDLVRSSGATCPEFERQYKTMDRGITDLMIQINDLLNLTEFEFSHQMVQTRVPVTLSVQTVLIVDDQDIISSILGQQLKRFVKRLNLLYSKSAEQALFLLNTNNVDFIFSDIMMPGMNGYEFVSQCRQQGFLVPIYLFSAGSDPHCREKSLDVGANGYIEKPATIEQLKKVTSLHLLHLED